jgi:hypothetical protein
MAENGWKRGDGGGSEMAKFVDARRGAGPRSGEVTGLDVIGEKAVEKFWGSEVIECGAFVCAESITGYTAREQAA